VFKSKVVISRKVEGHKARLSEDAGKKPELITKKSVRYNSIIVFFFLINQDFEIY